MNNTIQQLRQCRLDLRKDEVWRHVDFDAFLDPAMVSAAPLQSSPELTCNIPALDTYRIDSLPEGVTIRPFTEADNQLFDRCAPGTITRKFQRPAPKNPYLDINREGMTGGYVLEVAEGIRLDKPIQLLNIIQGREPQLIQSRNLILLGRGAEASFILCDDSLDQQASFSNNATAVLAAEGAKVGLYKMQNLGDHAALLNQTFIALETSASLRSMAITLNGGCIRNHTEVRLMGEHCDCQANGLYLIDKEQRADNYIFVEHAHPNCQSEELFKGIMDDSARATFNGHVLVSDYATKTAAFQTNKNILLTDKAHVETRPFLEIYNDDVKCSHGSTIGQLDEQALFYLRSRCIPERTARTMLLYAFCDEVLRRIELPALRDKLTDMVKKRLHGELTICNDCALHCSTPCNGDEAHLTFKIDKSAL